MIPFALKRPAIRGFFTLWQNVVSKKSKYPHLSFGIVVNIPVYLRE